MHLHPLLIGTSQGIINLNTINSITEMLTETQRQNGHQFGITIEFNNPDAAIWLLDDEARAFIKKIGLINWIPGTSSWAVAPEGEDNNG